MLSLLCPKRRTHRLYVCLYVCLCGCSGAVPPPTVIVGCLFIDVYNGPVTRGAPRAEKRMHNFLQRSRDGGSQEEHQEGRKPRGREVSDESDHDTIYWSLMRNKWTCHTSSRCCHHRRLSNQKVEGMLVAVKCISTVGQQRGGN